MILIYSALFVISLPLIFVFFFGSALKFFSWLSDRPEPRADLSYLLKAQNTLKHAVRLCPSSKRASHLKALEAVQMAIKSVKGEQ